MSLEKKVEIKRKKIKILRALAKIDCEHDLFKFGMIHFNHYLQFDSAEFHYQWAKYFMTGKHMFLCGFRESGKTLWFIIFLIWVICYKKYRFFMYYTFDERKAKAKLFEVSLILKTNKSIIEMYGELFPSSKNRTDDPQKKSMGEFITSNGIKFQAMSIGKSPRGEVFVSGDGSFRPDLIGLDDIDTIASVRNPNIVDNTYDFLTGEVFGGVGLGYKVCFLGNVISNDGIVPRFKEDVKNSPDWYLWWGFFERGIDTSKLWNRFVWTDLKAKEANKDIEDNRKHYISLETKERDQKEQFKANFLGTPIFKTGTPVFDQEKVQAIQTMEGTKDNIYPDLIIYKNPPKSEKCLIGGDVSEGLEHGDYSTIVVTNTSFEVIACYKGHIDVDLLPDVYLRLWNLGYKGPIGIEANNHGLTVIKIIQNDIKYEPLRKALYTPENELDKFGQKQAKRTGFLTTKASKPVIIDFLIGCIRDELIRLNDKRVKDELITYYRDGKGGTNALAGNYDDLVMGLAIALRMRSEIYNPVSPLPQRARKHMGKIRALKEKNKMLGYY